MRLLLQALAVAVLLARLCWRLMHEATYWMADFQVDAWLIAHQADSLRHWHVPSHFLHSDLTVFYPVFAFYGGTLFVAGGAIALAVGSPVAAQIIIYLLVLAAAYGGWLWLGRLAGLPWWQAHVPAILYVTSAYVITNIYVRQDLPETVATAVIPLLLASALSVLRAESLRAGPVAALAASTIALGGSHNLTLLWAATILGIVALVLAGAVPPARGLISKRGLLRLLAVMVPAMAVNAWYLVPDLAYHTHTAIAHRIGEWRELVVEPGPTVKAKYLFALGRPSPFPGSGLSLVLPLLAIVWVLIAAASARRQWRDAWARTLAILMLASIALLVLMVHPKLLTVLPDPWLMIQFSYRLESFILLGLGGAIIAVLVLLDRSGQRWLPVVLVPIALLGIVDAMRQIDGAPVSPTKVPLRFDNLASIGFGDFGDAQLPERSPPAGMTPVIFTRSQVDDDRIGVDIRARPADVIYTNVMVPAKMIDIQGARVVGRWLGPPWGPGWQKCSYLVLQVDGNPKSGVTRISMRQAHTGPVVAGRILSILGLLGLAANAVAILRGRRRGSTDARTPALVG